MAKKPKSKNQKKKRKLPKKAIVAGPPRISLITLGVADLAKSRKFYQQTFGWKLSKESQETVAFFKTEGVTFALYPRHLLAEDSTLRDHDSRDFADNPSLPTFRGMTLAINVREKKEVAQLLKKAAKHGAKIVKPAQDVFWGGHSGYFTDLDGHLWEIAWNPFFEFAADGSLNLA